MEKRLSTEIIPFKEPRALVGLAVRPPAVFLPDKKAAERFFGFFTANHQNKNTRRAHYQTCEDQRPPGGVGVRARPPPAVFLPDKKAAERFFGFFTANHQNKNTRRAYYKAACRFADWCEGRGLPGLADRSAERRIGK